MGSRRLAEKLVEDVCGDPRLVARLRDAPDGRAAQPSVLFAFCDSTSFHGLDFIRPEQSAATEAFWALIALAGIVATIVITSSLVSSYREQPTGVNQVILATVPSLPSIKVCYDAYLPEEVSHYPLPMPAHVYEYLVNQSFLGDLLRFSSGLWVKSLVRAKESLGESTGSTEEERLRFTADTFRTNRPPDAQFRDRSKYRRLLDSANASSFTELIIKLLPQAKYPLVVLNSETQEERAMWTLKRYLVTNEREICQQFIPRSENAPTKLDLVFIFPPVFIKAKDVQFGRIHFDIRDYQGLRIQTVRRPMVDAKEFIGPDDRRYQVAQGMIPESVLTREAKFSTLNRHRFQISSRQNQLLNRRTFRCREGFEPDPTVRDVNLARMPRQVANKTCTPMDEAFIDVEAVGSWGGICDPWELRALETRFLRDNFDPEATSTAAPTTSTAPTTATTRAAGQQRPSLFPIPAHHRSTTAPPTTTLPTPHPDWRDDYVLSPEVTFEQAVANGWVPAPSTTTTASSAATSTSTAATTTTTQREMTSLRADVSSVLEAGEVEAFGEWIRRPDNNLTRETFCRSAVYSVAETDSSQESFYSKDAMFAAAFRREEDAAYYSSMLRQRYGDFANPQLAQVRLEMRGLPGDNIMVEQFLLMGIGNLFSQLGGFIGLFMGGSVISIIHLFSYLGAEVFLWAARRGRAGWRAEAWAEDWAEGRQGKGRAKWLLAACVALLLLTLAALLITFAAVVFQGHSEALQARDPVPPPIDTTAFRPTAFFNFTTVQANLRDFTSCGRGNTTYPVRYGSNISITSPDYPNRYPPGARCRYEVVARPTIAAVRLEVVDFSMEEPYDQLKWLSNTSDEVVRSCTGQSSARCQRKLPASSQFIRLEMESDQVESWRGFQLVASVEEESDCASPIPNKASEADLGPTPH